MSRLPIIGGDYDAWGTVLNDYLTQNAGPHYTLSSGVSAGVTTFAIDSSAVPPMAAGTFVLIDAWTSQAELRKISSVSGANITVTVATEYAHTSGDHIVSINAGSLTPGMWGCAGDGSTDDQAALQEAIIQCAIYGAGIWLDGQNRIYAVAQPLMLSGGSKLKSLNVKALGSFAPAETNNAMGMSWNGNLVPFTANPATNVITAVANGIPDDNIGVVFQGTNLPGGLTAGKFYYARDRTVDTFKVSATSGGAEVDITSAGSGGRAFCEVYASNAKTVMEDCLWQGSLSVANLNGLLMSVQQPGYADKLRVDVFNGYGLKLKGQQYVLQNFESVYANKALVLDNMSFLWAYGFNAELCDNAVYVDTGGAFSCAFYGLHFEMNAGLGFSTASSIAVFLDNTAINMTFDNTTVAMQFPGQTFFKADTGSATSSGYTIRSVMWSGGTSATGQFMVNDVDRGVVLDAWDDCVNGLDVLVAPALPSSQSYPDPHKLLYIGNGNRRISFAAQNNNQSSVASRPATAQTGDQFRAQTTAGARVSGFNKAGVIFTEQNTVPADADLVAGELTFWLDDTNGACKAMFKAKQADGTVRTGSVALT